MKTRLLVVLFFSFLSVGCAASRGGAHLSYRDVSPYEYGLADAKTGVERYKVLLETHKAAVSAGVSVDYRGIKSIELEIPENASRIPLSVNNDFRGCVFFVKNTKKTAYLFDAQEIAKPINVAKHDVDLGNFRNYPEIAMGRCLLLIEDSNPWVDNRKGFDYGHVRKDILLLEDGIAKNTVVMPYDNEESAPVCHYVKSIDSLIVIKNLTIRRSEECTAITNMVFIAGKSQVYLSNIKILTPENDWRNDRAIRIENCTNVTLENVTINRTYSQINHSGYGISMNNIWNFYANHLIASGNWGVFGTNNINTALIENSAINRFDIHCYGKDVAFTNVAFSDGYNQLGSVYGNVVFNECTFTNFDPLINGATYNAYVDHNVIFNNCTFNVNEGHYCLLKLGRLDNVINTRKELQEKCWPNIYIKNMTVNMTDVNSEFVILKTANDGEVSIPIHYISTIEIDGMIINSSRDDIQFFISRKPVHTSNKVNCVFRDVLVNGESIESRSGVRMNINIPLKTGNIKYETSNKSD